MNTLEDLARYESAHSGLAFRQSIYDPADDAELITDCLALANAEITGRRFLFIGIDDEIGGRRQIVGVDKKSLGQFKRRFKDLIAESIEPAVNASVRAVEIDDRLVGYIRIKDCDSAPYLAKQSIGKTLTAGLGFIRRGSTNHPLSRSDMHRLFKQNQESIVTLPPVRVGFPGQEPVERLTLPALPLNKLPSQLAEERIKKLLEAKDQARELFGRTETQFSRLMHAKLYGMDVPFEKRSDDSLVTALDTVDADYQAADKHYIYEVRSHKLNLQVVNGADSNLHNARLRVTLPHTEGTGFAERIYAQDEAEMQPDGYPSIASGSRTLTLEAELGTLFAGRSVKAFREPARFWAREKAAGKAVPADYELTADELAQPIKGSLVIYIEKASLKSV